MEVRPGYKQTEVGVIPEDWEARSLDAISFVTSGKRLPLGRSLTDQVTAHPYVRVTDMRPGTVSLTDIKYVPVDVFPAIKHYRIFKDDIFISVAGTLGIIGKIPQELDGANLTENADRITNIRCSQEYLLNVLMSPLIQNTIDSLRTVGAQPKLALTRIRKFVIPLPPTNAEQEAIAEVLSDADALIESLERLIAKKRNIKQAAMQELLTGKKRLPGFSGEWQKCTLADIGFFSKGRGIKRDDVTDEGVCCIRYGELYTQYQNYTITLESRIPIDVANKALPIKTGDLLFAGSGETAEEIGRCTAYLGAERAYAGGDIVVLTPRGQNSLYLGHLMNHETVTSQKAYLGQGDAVVHISSRNLATIVIELPPEKEQTAIAAILIDMDVEIAALEKKLLKARQLKQGMMQELLTGRIRLI